MKDVVGIVRGEESGVGGKDCCLNSNAHDLAKES